MFDFYAGVLGRDGVRRRLVARLGPEAGDIIDEFLNFCLAQEKTGTPGLEAFLATLESAAPEIKREMDQGRAEVRIMTAHAAKGLEAPVVFLVDNGARPFSEQHLPRLLPFDLGQQAVARHGLSLARRQRHRATSNSRAAAARIRDAAEEEYRRLLYVGMTRAEDRLIVCGYHGKQQPTAGTWHALVTAALAALRSTEALAGSAAAGEPAIATASSSSRTGVDRAGESRRASAIGDAKPPAWLRQPVPPEPVLPRPLTPSRAPPRSRGVSDRRRRRARRCSTPARSRPSRSPAALPCTGCCRCCPALPEDEREAAARSLSRARRRRHGCRTSAAGVPCAR